MNTRLPWIVFFLSAALLGSQLALMRILSYSYWYHYAYMIISIALLGFGASGAFLTVARRFFLNNGQLMIVLPSLLCVAGLACTTSFTSMISVDPYLLVWQPSRFLAFFALSLSLFFPFFCGATVIGFSFILHPDRAGTVYFASLLGSGCGCLLGVFLMNWTEPASLPPLMALVALPAPLIASGVLQRLRILWLSISLGVGVILILMPPVSLPMSQFKSLARALLLPDATMTARAVSPLGVLETVESRALRYAPGMSLKYTDEISAHPGVFGDGEWLGSVIDSRDSAALGFLRHSTLSFPYCLKTYGRALVVGSGTGTELQFALSQGVASVTGIEQNGALLDLLERQYGDSTHTARPPGVRVVVSEARSFLARSTESFDLIIVPILEGYISSASGAHALFENYLFTVEAFRTMLDRLSDDGILVVHGWATSPPRGSVKTIALLVEAMRQQGTSDPSRSLAGIRSWGTFSFLAKKQPLTGDEIASIKTYSRQNGFDLIYLPGITEEEANRYHRVERPLLYEAAVSILGANPERFFDDYLFDTRPPTDDRPYFSHFVRWKSLPRLSELYSSGQIAFFELGFILLVVTFLQLLLLSFVLILLPLLRLKTRSIPKKRLVQMLIYFGGIGVGYMLIEMVLIQKFILFLGHPMYSVSIITASLLVFSGLGSLASQKMSNRFQVNPSRAIMAVLFLASVYTIGIPWLLPVFFQLEFRLRVVACVFLIAPLGFLMGIPFPLGLRQITDAHESLLPWAWGVNGCFSVISASLAVILSMELGFTSVSVFALLFYSAALFSHLVLYKPVE